MKNHEWKNPSSKIQLLTECVFLLEVEYAESYNQLMETSSLLELGELEINDSKKQKKALKKIYLIQEASKRIFNGDYGYCQFCKFPIWDLLLEVPYLIFCNACLRTLIISGRKV